MSATVGVEFKITDIQWMISTGSHQCHSEHKVPFYYCIILLSFRHKLLLMQLILLCSSTARMCKIKQAIIGTFFVDLLNIWQWGNYFVDFYIHKIFFKLAERKFSILPDPDMICFLLLLWKIIAYGKFLCLHILILAFIQTYEKICSSKSGYFI